MCKSSWDALCSSVGKQRVYKEIFSKIFSRRFFFFSFSQYLIFSEVSRKAHLSENSCRDKLQQKTAVAVRYTRVNVARTRYSTYSYGKRSAGEEVLEKNKYCTCTYFLVCDGGFSKGTRAEHAPIPSSQVIGG